MSSGPSVLGVSVWCTSRNRTSSSGCSVPRTPRPDAHGDGHPHPVGHPEADADPHPDVQQFHLGQLQQLVIRWLRQLSLIHI